MYLSSAMQTDEVQPGVRSGEHLVLLLSAVQTQVFNEMKMHEKFKTH